MNERCSDADRREFFRLMGRLAAGAGLAAMTAVLLVRDGDATATPTCTGDGRCGCCALGGSCSLPPARTRRQRTRREDGNA